MACKTLIIKGCQFIDGTYFCVTPAWTQWCQGDGQFCRHFISSQASTYI